MALARLLVANRGEIAIRIARAAAALGIRTVGVYSEDDRESLHVRHVDEARPLRGSGPRAYLDAGQLLAAARETGCDAVHPGYGFLSEQAEFARRCAEARGALGGPRAARDGRAGERGGRAHLSRRARGGRGGHGKGGGGGGRGW